MDLARPQRYMYCFDLVLADTLAVVHAADVRLAALLAPRIALIPIGALILALTAVARTEWTVAAAVGVGVCTSIGTSIGVATIFLFNNELARSILRSEVVQGLV